MVLLIITAPYLALLGPLKDVPWVTMETMHPLSSPLSALYIFNERRAIIHNASQAQRGTIKGRHLKVSRVYATLRRAPPA